MIIDHTIGKRVRDAREEEGLSREEVAEACRALGVARPLKAQTLKRIETAKKASPAWAKWLRQLRRLFPSLR
jgi:transcriptional regulator with XRE-family HTH domain